MRKSTKTIVITSALIAALAAAPALHAQSSGNAETPGPMMGNGMMEQGGMAGMMNMMSEMSQMMETCNDMMRTMMEDHEAPGPENEQPDRG